MPDGMQYCGGSKMQGAELGIDSTKHGIVSVSTIRVALQDDLLGNLTS